MTDTEHILIVEDDDNLRFTLADHLELEGYVVDMAEDIGAAEKLLTEHDFDLVLLDIILPDGNGYELCRRLRGDSDVLILMLTARSMPKDVIQGFESGADDYLAKPYRSQELLLRIKALLRRKNAAVTASSIAVNGYQVDMNLRQVNDEDQALPLTKKAFDMLEYFLKHQNQACTRDEILDQVWGENVYIDNRTIDNFVSILKKQLRLTKGNAYYIQTVRGVGYALIKDDASLSS